MLVMFLVSLADESHAQLTSTPIASLLAGRLVSTDPSRNDTTAKITASTRPPDIPHHTLSRISPFQSGALY